MDDAILMLRLEHQKMREVLSLLASQLEALDAKAEPDITLMDSALTYLVGYSQECHHPKEELVYHKLVARSASESTALIDLEKEHEVLRKLTRDLCAVVEQGGAGDRERMRNALRQYLDYYRHHMAMEETHLFKVARDVLTDDDWSAIEFSMFDVSDPLAKHEVDGRYAELHKALKSMAESHQALTNETDASVVSERDLSRLHGVNTIAALNAMPETVRAKGRLARRPHGGYTLFLRNPSRVLDIPECSEQRALWCAYYFLRGLETARSA